MQETSECLQTQEKTTRKIAACKATDLGQSGCDLERLAFITGKKIISSFHAAKPVVLCYGSHIKLKHRVLNIDV